MDIVSTRTEIQKWSDRARADGRIIALVPTMGAVHEGHLSLARKAHETADCVVASLFVNPAQFIAGEDLDTYPRRFDDDAQKFQDAGCACLYCPDADQMYPPGTLSHLSVRELSDRLEGSFRPHFFYGVTDAVCRLFIHTRPSVAVFGEKDYQQLVIVRRMTRDLGFDVSIIAAPTVRETSGLALSSRNAYLSPEDADRATGLYKALCRTARRIGTGESTASALRTARNDILKAGFGNVDYVAACDSEHLTPLPPSALPPGSEGRLLAAATIGDTRLIDNIALAPLTGER